MFYYENNSIVCNLQSEVIKNKGYNYNRDKYTKNKDGILWFTFQMLIVQFVVLNCQKYLRQKYRLIYLHEGRGNKYMHGLKEGNVHTFEGYVLL